MKPGIKLKDYCAALAGQEHEPVSLALLMLPFGITLPVIADQSLLLGLVLDALAEDFDGDEWVAPLDVAATAASLGHADAARLSD